MFWIPATLAASALQVARNAAQRGLIGGAGPWGATLVRFLFGLPFSLIFVAIAWALSPHVAPRFGQAFLYFALTGALSQVLATAALLRSGLEVDNPTGSGTIGCSATWRCPHARRVPLAVVVGEMGNAGHPPCAAIPAGGRGWRAPG